MTAHPLPSPEEIARSTDRDALFALKDEVQAEVIKMETDLEFRSPDTEWSSRCRSALARHRQCLININRRLKDTSKSSVAKGAGVRPDDVNHPFTRELLEARPTFGDVEDVVTTAACDRELVWLTERVNAISDDRDDEVAQSAAERDEGFLAATNSLLRELRARRAAVQNRRGAITKAEKSAAHAARDQVRERLFIEAAASVLDRETYRRLWDRVTEMERLPPEGGQGDQPAGDNNLAKPVDGSP